MPRAKIPEERQIKILTKKGEEINEGDTFIEYPDRYEWHINGSRKGWTLKDRKKLSPITGFELPDEVEYIDRTETKRNSNE